MRILITGNMGYVGPVVVQHLRERFPDAELVGFDAGYFGACLTSGEILPETGLDAQHLGDVRRFDPSLLDGVDHVLHLAAISNDPISNDYEQVTHDINHRATVAIARAARERGVKGFHFASSCSMYGYAAEGARTEDSELNPLTPYARSKVAADHELRELGTGEFTVTSLRFSTACGWSPRLRLDLVLNDFVACAVAGKPISILSDGTPWRPLINVRDMARALEWAVLRRELGVDDPNLAVNVGRNAWNYQVRQLADTVARHVPGSSVSVNPDAPPDRRSYQVDFSRYERLAPDHQPQVDLDHSVQELRDGLQSIGFADGEFRDSIFMRINHLNLLRSSERLDAQLRWNFRRTVGSLVGGG